MPVSTPVHISTCMSYITTLNPRSVLDVGCGFGLWGFLCREYLDVWNGRVQPSEWQVRIDGIELFEPYIQAHQRALYSQIMIADIRVVLDSLEEYDLIIAGDVIEHLEKPEGERVIERLYDRARKALLINLPLGDGWDHPEAYGNPGELHRSQWLEDDLIQYPRVSSVYTFPCGPYGIFWCPKDCGDDLRVEGLRQAAHRQEMMGNTGRALELMRRAQAIDPSAELVVGPMTDLLLRMGRPEDAADTLRRAVEARPGFYYARLALARILTNLGVYEEARRHAAAVHEDAALPEEIRNQAARYLT